MADTTQQATAHTPGPWKINHGRETGYPYCINGDSGERIITWGEICRKASAEGQANARLIAAAPDLLEALKACSPLLIPGMTWSDETGQLVKRMVMQAIAKAEARQ